MGLELNNYSLGVLNLRIIAEGHDYRGDCLGWVHRVKTREGKVGRLDNPGT